jgi:type VI protein secretion system component Hcp
MSFIAKLKLDGEEMSVLHCAFRFTQATDGTGKPTAIPQGGAVTLIIESNGSTGLFDWMVSPTQTKNGDITFYRRDNMSKLKTLHFTDAHCVDYYETFDHFSESPMQVQITLSAKEVKLNESKFKNNWPQ